MTSGQFTPLSDLERDALGEISNIAMARAANSLRQMVEHEVLLSVPTIEILSQEGAAQIVAKPDNPKLVAVRQDFSAVEDLVGMIPVHRSDGRDHVSRMLALRAGMILSHG